ncbi:MAG: cobalamin biosynthesis protein [Devosiaceae bacterium]|nr:cobalamin biosynthesis protein [Devosiaceae bacterium MH13]
MLAWLALNASALAVALLMDAMLGEPKWLWNRLPHPVVMIGKLIKRADERLNDERFEPADRRKRGQAALVQVLLLSVLPVAAFWWLFSSLHPALGWVFAVVVGAVLLAQRSLYEHVNAVRAPLASGSLGDARQALSMIVGRQTETLDESGIARAALESLAENHSDGVIAPAFWMLLAGPIGIVAYKAINTADSMIGYKSERYLDFGRAAAKVDDAANWVPARLAPALIALGVLGAKVLHYPVHLSWPSWSTIRNDAPTHASPNAGWPEAAYASALGIALGGPRRYATGTVDAPYINDAGRKSLTAEDVRVGLLLFHASCGAMVALVFFLALIGL